MRHNPPSPNITGDLARLILNYTGPSGKYINVFDYMANGLGTITSAVLTALMSSWQTNAQTQLLACLSQQITLAGYTVQDLNPGTHAGGGLTVNAAGTVAQAPLPDEMAVVTQKQSSLKGQHGRGRFSLPGVPVTFTTPATNPDVLNATGTTAYQALLAKLPAQLTAAGVLFSPVITQRATPPLTVPTQASLVTQWTLDTTLGTVRRRKPGRGR